MADRVFQLSSAQTTIDIELEFIALSVVIDNPTNQWVYLPSLGVTVPQYTIGAVYPLPATHRARAILQAPPGQVNPPSIAAQTVQVVFNSLALPPSAGVGMLGGRAPYYDRNPLSIVKSTPAGGPSSLQNANAGTVALWTYTVPAGRRAYIELALTVVQIQTAYANDDASIESVIRVALVGGSNVFISEAFIWHGTAAGTWSGVVVGASIEIQAGEVVDAVATDLRAAGAGASIHVANLKATEFDA